MKFNIHFACILCFALAIHGLAQAQTAKPKAKKSTPREAKLTPIEAPVGLGMSALTLLTDSSQITWAVHQPAIRQTGTFGLQSGKLYLNGQALGAGELVLNMRKVACTTFDDGVKNQEIGEWLQSPAYFNVKKHPTAYIMFDKVMQKNSGEYIIVAKLSMCGKTVESTFPVLVRKERGMTILHGTIQFDRTHWGLTAGSLRYFPALTENIISEEVDVEIDLRFAK